MNCTPLTASWCPVCGDCTCDKTPEGHCCFDGKSCPLHTIPSKHAETVELESFRERTRKLPLGDTLTPHDAEQVARFHQFVSTRMRERPLTPKATALRKKIL
jgi:hypothetical protein